MGIVISPILKILHTSTMISSEAQSIYEATYSIQSMMEELKESINRYLEYKLSNSYLAEDERKYVAEIDMLLEGTKEEIGSAIDFITMSKEDENDFRQRYETDQYIYDIGIWRIGKWQGESLIQDIPYDEVTKLSTQEIGEEKLYKSLFEKLISGGELEFSIQAKYNLFRTNYKVPQTHRGKFTITWQRGDEVLESLLRDDEEKVQEKIALLKNGETLWGEVEKIRQEGKDTYQIKTDKKEQSGEVKITIDFGRLGYLVGEEGNGEYYRPIVIENKTGYDLAVEFIYSSKKDEELDKSLIGHIVEIENRNREMIVTQGRHYKRVKENFVIAGLVRKKEPPLGEKGKIIKKMIDIYSPSHD